MQATRGHNLADRASGPVEPVQTTLETTSSRRTTASRLSQRVSLGCCRKLSKPATNGLGLVVFLNLDLLPFPTTFTIFGGVVPSMCVSSLASLWMCGAGCQLTSNPKLWHEPHPKRHFRRVSQLQAGSHQSEPEDRKTRGSQLR